MFKNLLEKDAPKATIRDRMLVLSLTNAIDPVVWRLDMRDIVASALEIRKAEENEGSPYYELILKTPKARLNTLAKFETREKALSALKTVTKAIEQAPTQQLYQEGAPSSSTNLRRTMHQQSTGDTNTLPELPEKMSSKGRPVLAGVIGAVIMVLLLFAISRFAPERPNLPVSQGSQNTQGAPLSANEFLKSQ